MGRYPKDSTWYAMIVSSIIALVCVAFLALGYLIHKGNYTMLSGPPAPMQSPQR